MPVANNVQRVPGKAKTTTYKYDNLPEDTYQVEILDVDHRQGPNKFRDDGEIYDWLNVTFVVLNDDEFEGEHNGKQSTRGRYQWDEVKWSMSPPGDYPASKLYRIASAVNGGKSFSKQECATFNPNDLIGRQLRIVVKERAGKKNKIDENGKEYTPWYNNISDYMSARRLLPAYDPETESFAAKNKTTVEDNLEGDDVPF